MYNTPKPRMLSGFHPDHLVYFSPIVSCRGVEQYV